MSIKRYNSTTAIVGQFLPKIYTRRITLESAGTKKNKKTNVTVDYQIKDVLDQNGIGIITQTRGVTEPGEQAKQDEILSALKIVLLAISNKDAATIIVQKLYNLVNTGYGRSNPFDRALDSMISDFDSLRSVKIEKIEDLARPAELDFQFRNTIYQQYDIDNNVINIIPGTKRFELFDDEWDNLSNLTLVCFSYFDFSSLGLESENLSQDEIRKLSYTIGDLTVDAVTSGGQIVSSATVYKVLDTNQQYSGPVHLHTDENPGPGGYTGYMAGYPGADVMGARLRQVKVPVSKIQDFRAMQRTKLVNYQPDQLEYYSNRTPNLDFIDNGDENYFDLTDVQVNYDREEGETNIQFTIDMQDIYKRNSRYYDLVKNNRALSFLGPTILQQILELKIVRRRMTSGLYGNDRLGSIKRKPFMPEIEPDHIVVRTVQTSRGAILEKLEEDLGFIRLQDQVGNRKTIYAADYQISQYEGTEGVYQYGVELKVLDSTKSFMLQTVERARRALEDLKRYSQEAKIPVFDTMFVNKPEESAPIGLSEDPSYSADITQVGNYDAKTNTFTKKFIDEANRKYSFNSYVNSFLSLVSLSFGKAEVKLQKRATSTLQTENALQTPLSALDSLRTDQNVDEAVDRQFLRNMIKPNNSRPETIDSFIRSFEDLVLEMENYFGAKYESSLSNEGGGYSAKSDNSYTVKRWIDTTSFDDDIDTLVHMNPYTDSIYFDYDLATTGGSRIATMQSLKARSKEEMDKYGIASSGPAVFAPKSLNIGSWSVCFDKQHMEKKKIENSRKIKSLQSKKTSPKTTRRKLRKLKKKKYVHLDPTITSHVNAISTFVTALQPPPIAPIANFASTFSFINATANLSTENFFTGIMAFNDEALNNAVQYSKFLNARPINIPTVERIFPEDPNECGLIDNRNTKPKFVKVDREDFIKKQGLEFNFGFRQEEVPIPRIFRVPDLPGVISPGLPVPTLPGVSVLGPIRPELPNLPLLSAVPQIASSAFPSGGIFDDAMVTLTTNSGTPLKMAELDMQTAGSGISMASVNKITGNGLTAANNRSSKSPPSLKPMAAKNTTTSIAKSFTSFSMTSRTSTPTTSMEASPPPPPSPQGTQFRAAPSQTSGTGGAMRSMGMGGAGPRIGFGFGMGSY